MKRNVARLSDRDRCTLSWLNHSGIKTSVISGRSMGDRIVVGDRHGRVLRHIYWSRCEGVGRPSHGTSRNDDRPRR